MSALISVLMPTFDGEAFVAEAITSVLAQRAVALELVVVDDGSTDSTPAIVEELARRDPRVRFAAAAHAGMAATRNACLATARGSHVALLDQDDRYPEGKLARQLARLQAGPDVAAVFGLTRQFGDRAPAPPQYTMLLAAALMRRDAVDAVGRFDPDCATADDLDFLLRLIESGAGIELEPEIGIEHRRHPGQASADMAATRRDCVRALARSLVRRRRAGLDGPLRHPLVVGAGRDLP